MLPATVGVTVAVELPAVVVKPEVACQPWPTMVGVKLRLEAIALVKLISQLKT